MNFPGACKLVIPLKASRRWIQCSDPTHQIFKTNPHHSSSCKLSLTLCCTWCCCPAAASSCCSAVLRVLLVFDDSTFVVACFILPLVFFILFLLLAFCFAGWHPVAPDPAAQPLLAAVVLLSYICFLFFIDSIFVVVCLFLSLAFFVLFLPFSFYFAGGHPVVPDLAAQPPLRTVRRGAGAVQGHSRGTPKLQQRNGRTRGQGCWTGQLLEGRWDRQIPGWLVGWCCIFDDSYGWLAWLICFSGFAGFLSLLC